MKETKQQPFYMFWRSNFDNSSFKEDIDLLSTFYRNKGYRDFEVLKDTISYSDDLKKMNIVLTLSEGEKYKYRNFSWGRDVSFYRRRSTKYAFPLKKGSIQ